MLTWRTLQDGRVEVNGEVPTLSPAEIAAFRRRVMRWLPSATRHGDLHRVPVAWILGVIWAESTGVPDVVSRDHGYGLMQLTSPSLFEGYKPKATLEDPDLNISLGTKFLGHLRKLIGFDLPKIASAYNAGMERGAPHPSATSPWGLRETSGHIMRVVRGANTALDLLESPMSDEIRARIVQLARAEVGPGDLDHYWSSCGIRPTPSPYKKGGQWCGVFALAMLHDAGVATDVMWTIGAGFLEIPGRVLPKTKTPKPGDICYQDRPYQHHSIVEYLRDGMLATIDGNSGNAPGAVTRRVRPLPGDVVFYSIEPWLPADDKADTDPAPPPSKPHRPVLKRGSFGLEVREVQRAVGAKVDGIFGPKTELAVKAWQAQHGLKPDGVVGPLTWSAIDA